MTGWLQTVLRRVLMGALLALPTAALAQEVLYDLDGSRMRMLRNGDSLSIAYDAPRKDLAAEGITRGDVVFQGQVDRKAAYLDGVATYHTRRCGGIAYEVSGAFEPGKSFVLNGAAPVLGASGCTPRGTVLIGPVANLVFTYLGPAGGAGQPALPDRRAAPGFVCVTGVGEGDVLNLRTGPGMDYGVIGRLSGLACDLSVEGKARAGWRPVRQGDRAGWVAERFLDLR